MYRMSWYIMKVLRILILIFISRATSLEFSMTKNGNNYGPYSTKWYNYKECAGPRAKNVTISASTFITDQFAAVANYNLTFVVPAKIEEIKVVVYTIKGDQKSDLWNYKVNKPCQHFMIAGILQQYYHTTRSCVIPQGNYGFKSNYTDTAYQFFGSSFFYGEYAFKVNAIAKEGNILCVQTNALFTKKV